MKILYIGKYIKKIQSGADAINYRNISLLKSITHEIDFIYPESKGLINKLSFGISNSFLKELDDNLKNGSYTHVFISQSLYGKAAHFINKNYPYIRIITFCHNIEVDYARSYFKTNRLRALPFFLITKIQEKKCIRYSNDIITLNGRDSNRLETIYNRKSSIELPTSFDDVYDEEKAELIAKSCPQIDFLFVGVAFFPNIQGVQWFLDNVMPFVDGDFYVIGKGMDSVCFKNVNERVHILGYVNDLSEYYYRTKVVVSTIFSGAGMKTKTAEALMYGKTIIGTNEAFEGYINSPDSMLIANNQQEFISSIKSVKNYDLFNKKSREIFLTHHETSSLSKRMKQLFI